jgi:hypothetical protein
MTRQMFIVLLAFGAVLAGASLFLRALTAGKYEFQTIDLIFLVIPLLVVALATGNLRSVDFFGLRADLLISAQTSKPRILVALCNRG